MEMEIWKEIEETNYKYSVSNYGRIKNNKTNNILKPHLSNKGYYDYGFCIGDNKRKFILLHQLVAKYFVYNPNVDEYTIVNHKDEVKTNNYFENLEWCNYDYNMNYGTAKNRRAKTMGFPIKQLSKDGELIKIWSGIKEASKELNINDEHIVDCLKGKIQTYKGYRWEYLYNYNDYYFTEKMYSYKKILQFDYDGNLIKEWNNSNDILNKNRNWSRRNITEACCGSTINHKAYGYIWRYKLDYDIESGKIKVDF